MKIKLTILAALAFAPAAFPVEYTRFRVCEDQHIIRTSDGAEAGHVEYILVEPTSHRIVSTVVTGGIVGDKFVAVPFESMRFNAEREIVLNEITRERLVSAPVIERTQISSTTVIQPALLERTSAHFGVRFDAPSRTDVNVREGDRSVGRETERTSTTQTDRTNNPVKTPTERTNDPTRTQAGRATAEQPNDPPKTQPGRTTTEQTNDPAKTQPGRATTERTNDPAKTQPGRAATEPARDRDAANPNRPDAAGKEQQQPARDTEKSQGRSARDAEKATPDKPDRTPAKATPDNPDRTPEKATTDKSDRSTPEKATPDKSRDKTDREAGKTDEKSTPPQPRPDKEKRTPE